MPTSSQQTREQLYKFLQIGMSLTLTFEFGEGNKFNYPATFIGRKEDGYLILDVSQRMISEQSTRRLENADVIVRGVSNTELGHVIAFKTSVLVVTNNPSPILFTRLPFNFASKAVREHERYKLDLPCNLDHQGNLYEATLADFSVSGCGIKTLIEPDFKEGDRVFVESEFSHFIDQDNKCLVAKITKLNQGWFIGVRFENTLVLSNELKSLLLESSFESGLL
jgi:hypothetical protein